MDLNYYNDLVDLHIVDLISFDVTNSNLSNPKIYYKNYHTEFKQYSEYLYDGLFEIIDTADYIEDNCHKIETRFCGNSRAQINDVLNEMQSKFPWFTKSEIFSEYDLEDVSIRRFLISYLIYEHCVKRISVYIEPERFKNQVSTNHISKYFFPALISYKFKVQGRYAKYYFKLKDKYTSLKATNKLIGKNVKFPIDINKHFLYGYSINNIDDTKTLYFRPIEEGIDTVRLKKEIRVRKLGNYYFLIDITKRYDRENNITSLNEIGYEIIKIINDHRIYNLDYITYNICKLFIDYDSSIEYYGKVYSMIQTFFESMSDKQVIDYWRG